MEKRILIENAKKFVENYARPLDRAVYNFYFQKGTKVAVIEQLAKFQNEDGGFGHALELDNWNPASTPIATNDALITLQRIHGFDEAKQMVTDIVRYLRSHDSFNEEQRKWQFAIESTKDYPHAIWWEKTDAGIDGCNPTVSLAAFMLCYGDDNDYYKEIVREAFAVLKTDKINGDGLKCYMLSYRLLCENHRTEIIDLETARQDIINAITKEICKDTQKYGVEYVATPSDFFINGETEFLTEELKSLIGLEKELLGNLQKEDGGFDISWQWYNDYTEFEQARTLWRGRLTIDRILFVQNY